ncbi:tripartite tricarboxylate transporter substrate binding protein [Roseomonas sp. KE2513]|uniref:Bug family tripartite tricarboxylate transporter substrate binding protein n=1 Tax=Roseomonas sp. KE2513 TaxID=2479202 RepID=UPI0018DF7DAF|nr:tripartite tricarboxylate transporter substrate binding protein [Roseomonas sp. KE2513]MBI0536491.1 tripartite tricarboxylate transporter substrate binding protein [Roseomonas sp. KE2513]
MLHRRTLSAGLLAAPLIGRAWAQEAFPSRPVRLMCGYLPGGTTDIICRIVAERLSAVFGTNVVVENRSGASGLIAADATAKSPPDGYTVFQNSLAMHAIMPQLPGQIMPIDTNRDLLPLSNVAGVYNTLVVSARSPVRSVAELIDLAKRRRNELTFGSAGLGTTHHLAGELFMKLAGVEMVHVPYRGGPAAILDIIGGRCDMMFGNLPELIGYMRDGTLRPLAFGSARVSPLFPDVPLMSATLPGFTFTNWFGLAGPVGLPQEVQRAWSRALLQVAKDPDLDRRFTEAGIENLIGTQEAIRDRIREDIGFWGELIRSSGIRAT